MTIIELKPINRYYQNNGQHAEQVARFTLTGEICKADNKPFTAGGDCLDIQIKSARATICHGTDLESHMAMDGANRYGYVLSTFDLMYLMTKAEYAEFVHQFGKVGKASSKNGGGEVLRFGHETRAMVAWLRGQVSA